MNFAAYIERQKQLIRNRRTGTVYIERGEEYFLSQSAKIFAELSSLKGLNVSERLTARQQERGIIQAS